MDEVVTHTPADVHAKTLAEAPADVQATISRLMVYPVKSCAGVDLSESVLTETGLDLDRAWMLVDEQAEFLSQREFPRLALVQPRFKGSQELVLRAPGMLALHLAIESVEQAVRVRVWDDEVAAYDMGDLAAQWFSDFLSLTPLGLPGGKPPKVRLVRFDPDHRRLSSKKWTGGLDALNQFSDGYPLLVLSHASLDDFNTRMRQAGHEAVGVERFRPNIVLSGLQAHDEDALLDLQIPTPGGPVRLRLVKPCPRCPIPNIDPATGVAHPAVGQVLQSYRRDPRVDGAVTFGMNAIVLEGLERVLRVGDRCTGQFAFDVA